MGVVYFLESGATPPRAIAAKTFRPEFPLDEIINELNIWLALSHPNILRLESISVLEFETAAISPWRHRGSLHDYVLAKHRLDSSEVKQILADAVSALRYAWEAKQIVHLDIKPQNMLMSYSPWKAVEIADWGLARISSEAEVERAKAAPESVQLTSSFSGTVPYMAPERFIDGVSPTIQADVFSLGVLAIECLTGSLPYTQDSDLIGQVLSGAYIHYSTQAVKELSSGWRKFLSRCLAYESHDRFDNYPEIQRAIQQL